MTTSSVRETGLAWLTRWLNPWHSFQQGSRVDFGLSEPWARADWARSFSPSSSPAGADFGSLKSAISRRIGASSQC